MGEQRAVRIRSCLCSVLVHFRCCKYIAISICNISSDNALCKRILPLIIRTIDKRLGFYSCEINEVPHQCNKQDHKEICNFSEIFILCAFPFFSAASVLGLLRISVRFLPSFGALFFPRHFFFSFLFLVFLFPVPLLHLLL